MSDETRVMRVLQGMKPGPNTMCRLGFHDWQAWEKLDTISKNHWYRPDYTLYLKMKRVCAHCNWHKYRIIEVPS